MQLVFLHGPPAVGKLTVARALFARTGLPVFHNHLTVDLVGAVFPFGSEAFVRLRERIWLDVFGEAARDGRSLIFTFNPESTVQPHFATDARKTVEDGGGRVRFVELRCDERILESRIESPSRVEFGKLRSLQQYRELRAANAFDHPPLPESDLVVDTGAHEPAAAALAIAEALGLPRHKA